MLNQQELKSYGLIFFAWRNIQDVYHALDASGKSSKDTVYSEATGGFGRASDCISCKQCERACPQHLPITGHLKEAVTMFE